MIVYEKGKPKRADYRKFKIKSVEGPNDYASMKEVLSRRFLRGIQEDSGFERLPDLIMMDGGRGQVNIALEVLEEMDLAIPVCGMVKDDFHRTRALYYNNEIIEFPKNSEAFLADNNLEDKPVIALLAGSRKQEIKDNLPDMLKAASAFPDYQLVLAGAPGIVPEYYKQYVGQAKVKIIFDQTYRLLQHAEAALVTSGTATLETALFRVPQVVCYYTCLLYTSPSPRD